MSAPPSGMNCLIERLMPFDVALTAGWNITEENDLLRPKPLKHLVISVHEQRTCCRAFLRANRRNGNTASRWFTIKAPLKAVVITPADGRNDSHAPALPVGSDQMLAVVIVDLHGSGIIGKETEIRGHNRLEFREKQRIASGVMPCALKDIIVNKEMDTMFAAPSICVGTVEADPLNVLIRMNRREHRRIIAPLAFESAKPQVMSVALHCFKSQMDHLLKEGTPHACQSVRCASVVHQEAAVNAGS